MTIILRNVILDSIRIHVNSPNMCKYQATVNVSNKRPQIMVGPRWSRTAENTSSLWTHFVAESPPQAVPCHTEAVAIHPHVPYVCWVRAARVVAPFLRLIDERMLRVMSNRR